ncbi:hypothetical protein LTR62_003538 [Meristemomyces frigidus]|uniref:Cytochrome P450 n=1 Tax=Meristemomyces frigidus TaxID=1508187 RepID=A0AAN7TG18_9PEZI|nr:hypothetical protein LTR62_003538 [Meristemomyces frigidus]
MDRSLTLQVVASSLFVLLLTAALVAAYTYLSTLVKYRLDVRNNSSSNSKVRTARAPPLIPYAIPVLGSTITFSNQRIGTFWTWLRNQAQRYSQDAFSIMLSGTRTHFIFSEAGVSAIFKSRQLSRARLDQQLGTNVLGMAQVDAARAFPYDVEEKEKSTTARIHSENLLSSKAVDELTKKFMETLTTQLDDDDQLNEGAVVELYDWLWQHIFRSSTTAFCGSKLLDMFPDFDKDYRTWEDGMLGMLFGTPRMFAKKSYAARDATVGKLEKWLQTGYQNLPQAVDNDENWEPNFGAKVMRKRHDFYAQQDLSPHAQAGSDLIFLAGILSNATPATGWLLLHILSPTSAPNLHTSIMTELRSCHRADNTLDIPALTRLPRLNSAFHEVLRFYTDVLILRQVDSSVVLGGIHSVKQNEQVMAPSWLTHRNPEFFPNPEVFDPERFLLHNEVTGKLSYSASGLGGKYFPFGGGHYMCPGRTFAKQEVLGSIAVLLLNFEIEFVAFTQAFEGESLPVGKDAKVFPRMKRGYAGNQVVGIEGDMRVRIKRKKSAA